MKRAISKLFGPLGLVMFFATPSNPSVGADGGAGAGGAGGGAAPSGGTPPAGSGQGGAPPTDNIRQFREQYDRMKTDYEPWRKFSEESKITPDKIGQVHGTYKRIFDQVTEIGTNLGYSDEEILEAFETDPVKTLDYLRRQAAMAEESRAGDDAGSLEDQIQAAIDQRMGPIEQAENVRITDQANALFERTVHQEIVNAFKAEGVDVANIPQDEAFLLMSATSEIMKYDEAALTALKKQGSIAAVQKSFQEAKTMIDKYYLARYNREVSSSGPRKGVPPSRQHQGKRPNLDELIENPELINAKYKVGA